MAGAGAIDTTPALVFGVESHRHERTACILLSAELPIFLVGLEGSSKLCFLAAVLPGHLLVLSTGSTFQQCSQNTKWQRSLYCHNGRILLSAHDCVDRY